MTTPTLFEQTLAPATVPAAGPRPLVIGLDLRCPSEAGYQAHRARREEPCKGCREARNATRRAREAARPKRPRLDRTPARFWSKVTGGDYTTCWTWTAYIDSAGYGRFRTGGRTGQMEGAHRVAYRLLIGEVPDGLELDHLCRNPGCVNPWHLEPVTHAVNSRRSTAGEVNAARQRAITHCPQGHAYSAENTGFRRDGRRRCKACGRRAARARYEADPAKHHEIARRYRARRAAA
ncbi:MAG: HNH endonuclease [Actinomycetota bacterium]|nr:HNH endonuclease [Actinomycetota bacterium]